MAHTGLPPAISTRAVWIQDAEGNPYEARRLPRLRNGRWVAIGRLDFNTSGLLLFSNDGDMANRLMHPSNEVEREYAVRVNGTVTKEMLRQLASGVALEDGPAHFDDIVDGGGEGYNHWYYVVIREGRNREVRRLWEAVGATVSRLKRVRYGPIILDSRVRSGQWRELEGEERQALLKAVNLRDSRPWGRLVRGSRATKSPVARRR